MSAAHEEAQRRIIPMRARVLARIAEHLDCAPEDLHGTQLETDLTDILLVECAELLDPWGVDRKTPVIELPTDLAPKLEPEPSTVGGGIDEWHDDPWRDEPTVRRRHPSSIRPKAP